MSWLVASPCPAIPSVACSLSGLLADYDYFPGRPDTPDFLELAAAMRESDAGADASDDIVRVYSEFLRLSERTIIYGGTQRAALLAGRRLPDYAGRGHDQAGHRRPDRTARLARTA
jgi:hypothetical protein